MDKHAAALAVLERALPHVPFDGWSVAALKRGALEAGMSEDEVIRLFPRGAADAIDLFLTHIDTQMQGVYAALASPPSKIRERIARLVCIRLELLAPHREAVRRLLATFALPQHVPQAVRSLARTVDAIWYAAGDNAADFNWYSKRLLLSGVYSATLLYWLNDKSAGVEDTLAFLDRRIDNVMQIQKWKQKLSWPRK